MSDPEVERQLNAIAANVRTCRGRLGLTQEELGEATGISYRYLQDIERGRKNVTVETLVRLARALRTRPAALLKSARLGPAVVGRPKKAAGGRAG